MKRIFIILALCLLSSSLFAQFWGMIPGYVGMSVCYADTSHNFAASGGSGGTEDIQAEGIGVAITSFSGPGSFGFFSRSVVGLPLSISQVINGGTPNVMVPGSSGINIIMDMLAGLGYKIEMNYTLLFGAGLHFSGLALTSNFDIFLSYSLGPGVALNFLYPFTEGLYLEISGSAGYDFFELMHMPELPSDVEYSGGFSWNAGVGFGLKY